MRQPTRKRFVGFLDAFNRHDAEGLAALFAPDADFVDLRANWYKGRQELLTNTAFLHGTAARDAKTTTPFPPQAYETLKTVTFRFDSTSLKFITKDVAVAVVAWTQLGDNRFKDKPRQGMFTFVATRSGDAWIFRAARNTQRPN